MSSPHAENEECLEEFIVDGNTGATREMYHVSKQQLRDQAIMIREKLLKKGVMVKKPKPANPIANVYTPQEHVPEKKKRRKRKAKNTGHLSVDQNTAQLIGLVNSDNQ